MWALAQLWKPTICGRKRSASIRTDPAKQRNRHPPRIKLKIWCSSQECPIYQVVSLFDSNIPRRSSTYSKHIMYTIWWIGSENRGGCKKCGMLGHLTFQCRNTIQMPSSSAQDDSVRISYIFNIIACTESFTGYMNILWQSSDDSSDDNEEADTKKDRSRVEPIAPSSPDKKKRKYEDEDEDDSDSRDGELDHRESKSHKKSEKSSKHKHKHKHKHDKKEKKSKHKKEKKSSSDWSLHVLINNCRIASVTVVDYLFPAGFLLVILDNFISLHHPLVESGGITPVTHPTNRLTPVTPLYFDASLRETLFWGRDFCIARNI